MRCVENAVSYAISDRVKAEILAILNEGARSREELAYLVGEPPDKIKHHIRALLKQGSIEIAYTEQVGNMNQYFYRAVKIPFYTDEEIAAMPPAARQAVTGVALQAIMAEALAAFWAGKMIDDRRMWMAWRWFNVDRRGRGDIADEQARSWERYQEIEAESTNRCAKSGEPTKSIIVSSLGYVRCRTAPSNTPGASPSRPSAVGNVLGPRGQLPAVRP
jgi:DNA-binding transcriptional ArsR family regulator